MTDNPHEWHRVFGPVPSRRLGRSICINNIPPKICTYSCVYCQIGRTKSMTHHPKTYYSPEQLCIDVEKKLKTTIKNSEHVDILTVVSDGEPTLDNNLGKLLKQLNTFGLKTAVITNASLMNLETVRDSLMEAHWVSTKVDCVNPSLWRPINRPHNTLQLETILKGIQDFSDSYPGELVTETMLVKGINTSADGLKQTAKFLKNLNSHLSYISVPTRPPAETWVEPPSDHKLNEAWHIFSEEGLSTEFLTGYEGDCFSNTGNAVEDILSITAVHPMKNTAVFDLLKRSGEDPHLLHTLVQKQLLKKVTYKNDCFYLRRIKAHGKPF